MIHRELHYNSKLAINVYTVKNQFLVTAVIIPRTITVISTTIEGISLFIKMFLDSDV